MATPLVRVWTFLHHPRVAREADEEVSLRPTMVFTSGGRDHIEGHFADPDLSLATLAGVAGWSPSHLIRAFRAATGLVRAEVRLPGSPSR